MTKNWLNFEKAYVNPYIEKEDPNKPKPKDFELKYAFEMAIDEVRNLPIKFMHGKPIILIWKRGNSTSK